MDANPLPTGQWVQVAVTISGDTGVLYENGQPVVAGQIPLNPSQISQTLNYIGKSQYSSDPLFSGEIADFRIYNYALSQSQMSNLVPLTWTGSLSSTWTAATLAGPNNWQVLGTSAAYSGGDVVLFNDTAANFTVNVADTVVSPASILFSNSANNYVLNGPGGLAGSGGLTKNGAAALTINNANTYSGGTMLSTGTLNINNGFAIGTGSLSIAAGATIDNTSGSAITLMSNNPQTWGGNFTFGGHNALNMGAGAVTITGNLTVTTGGTAALTVGPIGQSGGTWQVTEAGSGMLVLSGNNSYSGSTTISGGTLQIGNGGTAGSLSIESAITDNGTLAFDRSNSITQGAQFTLGAITGTGGLLQLGAGTLTLSKNNNYTGATIVDQGTLLLTGSLNPSGGLGVGGGSFVYAHSPAAEQTVNGLTIYAGASVINNTSAGTLALGPVTRNAGGTVDFPATTGTITTTASNTNGILGPWALVGTGAGTFYAYSNSGTIAGYSGAVVESGSSAFGGIPSGGSGTINYNVNSSGTFAAMGSSCSVNTIAYSGSGATQPAANATSLTINGILNTGTGPLTIGGSPPINVTIGANQDLVVATMTGGVVINNNISDSSAGPSALTTVGSGTLTLNGANSYSGPTTIGGGTLQIGSGGAAGSLAIGSVITDNGTLVFSRSNNITQGTDFSSAAINGTGGIATVGGGNLTLNALNTFSGNVTVSGGTLTIGSANQLNVGATGSALGNPSVAGRTVTINSGGVLAWGGGNQLGGPQSGMYPALSFVINQGGSMVGYNGDMNTIGNLTLNGGTLTTNNGLLSDAGGAQSFYLSGGSVTAGGSSPSLIAAGGSLYNGIHLAATTTFNVAATGGSGPDLTVSATLADRPVNDPGSSTLVKTGAGLMRLTAPASYTGNTAVTGGTLQLGAMQFGSAAVAQYEFSALPTGATTVPNLGSLGASASGMLATGAAIVAGAGRDGQNALQLTGGSTSYVQINSGIVDLSSTSNWTVTGWFQTTTAGATLFYKGDGSTWVSGNDTFYLTNGNANAGGTYVGAVRWGGGWVAGNTSVNDGSWHFFAITDAAGTKSVYTDGTANTLTANSFINTDVGNTILIGKTADPGDGTTGFNGLIDSLSFYNTALNATQIQALAGGGNILPGATNLQIGTGAVVDLGGINQQVASLADYQAGNHGTILNSSTSGLSVLALNPSAGVTATFSGQILGGGSLGTINLAMIGAGTQILAGSNTYTGSTAITTGTLQLGNGGTTGSLWASSGILDYGTLALDRSNSVTQGVDFSSAAITGTGGLAQLGTGNLVLNQANSYSGGTTITAGTLQIGAGGNSGTPGTRNIVIGNAGALVFDRSDSYTLNNNLSGAGGAVPDRQRRADSRRKQHRKQQRPRSDNRDQ